MEKKRTDIHCHILPGIDDGARDLETSLDLLRGQKEQGVRNIVFTPHFNFDKISIDEFEKKRSESLKKLTDSQEFRELAIDYRVGAEVYYTVDLGRRDLDKLCFSGSDYVLIELPTQARPHGVKRTFGDIISNGYRPILAHVERYSYMLSNPEDLYDMIDMGCLAHINAEALINKSKATPMLRYFIRCGLVHTMCTDCHSRNRRPPNLDAGMRELRALVGREFEEEFTDAADAIFHGRRVDTDRLRKPKNLFGIWV